MGNKQAHAALILLLTGCADSISDPHGSLGPRSSYRETGGNPDIGSELQGMGAYVERDGWRVLGITLQGQCANRDLAVLASFPDLETLIFSGSTHSNDELYALQHCPKLRALVARDCDWIRPSGFARIGQLRHLQYLDVSGTRLDDDDLAKLGKLRELHTLDVARTAVTDAGLRHLGGLTRLEDLHLSGTSIQGRGFGVLSVLSNLRDLDVSNCELASGTLRPIGGLRRLEFLKIGMNPQIVDADLDSLSGCFSLNSIDASGTGIRGPGIRALSRLEFLTAIGLADSRVDDGIFPTLTQLDALPRIESLGLAGTSVSYAGIERFLSVAPLGLKVDPPIEIAFQLGRDHPTNFASGFFCGGGGWGIWHDRLCSVRESFDQRTPLIDAIEIGDQDDVKSLIRRRTDVERRGSFRFDRLSSQTDPYWYSQLVTPLYAACALKRDAIAESLLSAGAQPDATLTDGKSALFAAAYAGDLELVTRLLALGANPTRESGRGWTPLSCALRGGHLDVARALQAAGAVHDR